MYLCYIDESGTPDIPGNTSHYVLAGLAIPIKHWKTADEIIDKTRIRYGLEGKEIHTAWMLRKYLEQDRIKDFALLDYVQRRSQVEQARKSELLRLQRSGNPKHYKQTKKNYEQTEDYVHLTHSERYRFIEDVAKAVSGWGEARLFAECIDKVHFDPARCASSPEEQAFTQLVSRFEQFLKNKDRRTGPEHYGLLVHDNNKTVASKHTQLMKSFHDKGTLWTAITHIIETPFFVDSELTGMIQIADLCAYSLRRYLENNEDKLFDLVFQRADRAGTTAVGVRHFTNENCSCKICSSHRVKP